MKSYTPSLIGWIVLFPIACVTLFDKNIRFPVSLSITLGLVMFLGQFTSLFWGLCGIIVNSNRKDDLIALINENLDSLGVFTNSNSYETESEDGL